MKSNWMVSGIIDMLLGILGKSGKGRSVKRKREVNTAYHKVTVKPLKSNYSYASDVDNRSIERAKRRRGNNR